MLRVAGLCVVLLAVGCGPAPIAPVPPAAPPSEPRAPEARPEPPPPPTPTPPQARAEQQDPEDCNPLVAPLERRDGGLVVHAPPRGVQSFRGRLRSHITGSLSAGSERVWAGPQVPGFVPLTDGPRELFLLDHQPDGSFMALYREPYANDGACPLGSSRNCTFVVTVFERCGDVRWSYALHDSFPRADQLEVQDVRVVDGTLYYNEACQTYSRDAGKKCSYLVAADPQAGQTLWRSRPLVSNNRFAVVGDYIVAGYGFTAEKDTLKVVRRSDGKVMHSVRLPKAPEDVRLVEPGVIEVVVYPGDAVLPFRLQGWDGDAPKLQRIAADPPSSR